MSLANPMYKFLDENETKTGCFSDPDAVSGEESGVGTWFTQ